MQNISIIVAIAENNAIGNNNQLLWHIPEDLKRFKRLTTGHQIIMGRKTYFSLPKRPLPNRTNIVLTDVVHEKFEGCITVYSINEILDLCSEDESFIIGGGMLYKQFLPYANKLYLSVIHKTCEADTFFPTIDYSQWNEIVREVFTESETSPVNYTYLELVRKK